MKTNPFQRVDWSASKRAGRIVTYGETHRQLMQLALGVSANRKKTTGALSAAQPVKEVKPSGNQLFDAMMLFYRLGIHVNHNIVGQKKYMVSVEHNKETFLVNFSKTKNCVVVYDRANKKALTVEQFIAFTGKPLGN